MAELVSMHDDVMKMEEAIRRFNKNHTNVQASLHADILADRVWFRMTYATPGETKMAEQEISFSELRRTTSLSIVEAANEVLDIIYTNLRDPREKNTMDLYDAIDTVSNFVNLMESFEKPWHVATAEELDAIKICLEAAKDKGGV